MPTRLARLFSTMSSLPGILFIWGAADILGRVQFINTNSQAVRSWLVTLPGAVFALVLSAALIVLVVIWPEINGSQWIPKKSWLPTTNHERLAELERKLPEISTLSACVTTLEASVLSTREDLSRLHGRYDITEHALLRVPRAIRMIAELSCMLVRVRSLAYDVSKSVLVDADDLEEFIQITGIGLSVFNVSLQELNPLYAHLTGLRSTDPRVQSQVLNAEKLLKHFYAVESRLNQLMLDEATTLTVQIPLS